MQPRRFFKSSVLRLPLVSSSVLMPSVESISVLMLSMVLTLCSCSRFVYTLKEDALLAR